MKHYSCILFDLDGTLADTFSGILHSYEFAAEKLGLPVPTEKIVNEVIGAPLAEVFREHFNMDEERVREAIFYYRKEYAKEGILRAKAYAGMEETLRNLKESQKCIGVTTLKNEEFAKQMLKNMNLDCYMDVIIGMDGKDKLTKAMLITKAISQLNQKKESTVLVGDSCYDAVGAKEAGIDFIGVTYGFGFKTKEDIAEYENVGAIKHPIEILLNV